MHGSELSVVCEGLLSKIFQPAQETQQGFVVLVTSMHPRAGVSQITRAMAESLDQHGSQFAILLNARGTDLKKSVSNAAKKRAAGKDPEKRASNHQLTDNWQSLQSHLASYFDQLRQEFRYVLIDCPSLKDSHDAITLAPLVDGVVLVVEANRTRKDQILYAERAIEAGRGRLLGHILNRRSYVVPDWLHRRMEAVGI
jgi:Mrp family chromosome partitioning ATPase